MANVILRRKQQDQKERGRYVALAEATPEEISPGVSVVVFHRVGEGFEEANESLSPQVQTRNYINGKSSSVTTGFQESIPISGERYVGDYANDLFAHMAENRAKGPDAAVSTLTVNFWESAEDPDSPGEALEIYRAFRQPGSYSPESSGGGGATDSVTISGTINLSGAPLEGWFKPIGAPTTENPDMDIRDMGIFSTDLTELL